MFLLNLELKKFKYKIESVMSMWSRNDDGADYICTFCKVRPLTNADNIDHDPDCYGQKILDSIKEN